jgi:exonuclease SbcD
MKFLHAADIHLDSPLTGLHAREDLPGSVIHNFTRRAFSAMVDLAVEEDVAFVIIAGDLYDGDSKDFSTGLFFAQEMKRLGRPCFLIKGNHDAASVITRALRLPPNVTEFSSRSCETVRLDDFGVALHGRSFPNRVVSEDLSASYPPPVPGLLNIGILHTSAEDRGEHEVYAPCSVADLQLKGYDYWALGHIHSRRILSERPWIIFPGNLQGRHARETGPKGCTLVTYEGSDILAVERRDVDVLRWAALEVDATGCGVHELTQRVEEAVAGLAARSDERPVMARLTLSGVTRLHGALLTDTEHLAAACRAAAIAAGVDLWVEDVRVGTRPPVEVDHGMLAPLRDAFMTGLDDPEIANELLAELARLTQKLPAPARSGFVVPQDLDDLRRLAEDAWEVAADALSREAGA